MKKVLVLSGSPRKKDSYHVVKLIEKKLQNLGEVELEYLMLRKSNIEYCRGCLACMRLGEKRCSLKDDVLLIYEKMQNADGVIFTSPVYVHTVSAPIKNLFDRMAYCLHRPCFHDKFAMIISTTELSGLNETLKYLAFPVKAMGFNLSAKIGVIAPAFDEAGPYQDKILLQIDKAANQFYQALVQGIPKKPKLSDVIFFNKLKTKISMHKDRFKFDYDYWLTKNWFASDYFYPAKIGFLQKRIGKLPVKMIKKMLRRKFGAEVYHKFVGISG